MPINLSCLYTVPSCYPCLRLPPNKMSTIWHKLSQVSALFDKSSEPLDQDGAYPVPSFLTRKLEDIDYVVKQGQPFSLADLVGQVFWFTLIN
jgi:hypothetical protein